jgi:hypothetical protein
MSKFCCFNLVTLKTQVRSRQLHKRSKEIDTSKGRKKKFKKGGRGGGEIVNLVDLKSSSSEDDSDDESEDEDAGSNYQERVSKANGNYDGSE